MNYYARIDVSLEDSCICVIDANGKVVREGKVSSEPTALIAWLSEVRVILTRIGLEGLEAGPLSQWLYAAMGQAGLPVELLETRHVRNAFKIMPIKTDRKDARGIARTDAAGLVPAGALQVNGGPGNACHADRARTGAKELMETESSLHGILGFGLKVGKTTPVAFEGRIRELAAGHPNLEVITSALLSVCAVLRRQFNDFEKRLRTIARTDTRARLLMTTPGVGVIVALTFACAIDDPSRFKSSKAVEGVFRHDANAISVWGN
jgi:transposase